MNDNDSASDGMPDCLVNQSLDASAGLRSPADNEGGRGDGRLRAFPGLQTLPVALSDWCATHGAKARRAAVRPVAGEAGIVDVVTTTDLRPAAILVSAKNQTAELGRHIDP